jgi:hypothetical protein
MVDLVRPPALLHCQIGQHRVASPFQCPRHTLLAAVAMPDCPVIPCAALPAKPKRATPATEICRERRGQDGIFRQCAISYHLDIR